MTTLLQIVPRAPGSFDGVGDYALGLAKALAAHHGYETIFAAATPTAVTAREQFPVVPGLDFALDASASYDHLVLHYANYGYQSRGLPLRLREVARQLRKQLRGRWITTFHELYAFGPPWKSAFWLHPFQKKIAHDIIDLSDVCVVSNDAIAQAIHQHDEQKPVRLVPVMSNFGEPAIVDLTDKVPARWAICGGTKLISRSLRSFARRHRAIPKQFFPEQIEIVGGAQSQAVRDSIRRVEQAAPGISCRYYPEVTASAASDILRRCTFAWIDYFGTDKVWPGMIFKSGSFAACCAHGVVPVLSHAEAPSPLEGDSMPGWFFITPQAARFPEPDEVAALAGKFHAWYHRHASAECAARGYAEALA